MQDLRPLRTVVTAAVIATTTALGSFVAKAQAATFTLPIDPAAQATGIDVVRDLYGLDGTGITIGVISDSFNTAPFSFNAQAELDTYGSNISDGYLPAGVQVLKDDFGPGSTDEGRAMLQLIHAIAPGASLAFYAPEDSLVDFGRGVRQLAAAGAEIIVDDLSFFRGDLPGEPEPPRGPINRAIKAVVNQGVSYFTSAGNYFGQSLPIFGHSNSPDALTLGAVYYGNSEISRDGVTRQGELEPFSSAGNPASPYLKPDVVAPDGVSVSFQLCNPVFSPCDIFSPAQFNDGFYSFFGTSAAAPFTAAAAALLLQADPSTSPTELYDALRSTAQPLAGQTGFNNRSGYGLIQADRAAAALGIQPKPIPVPEPSPVPTVLAFGLVGVVVALKRRHQVACQASTQVSRR